MLLNVIKIVNLIFLVIYAVYYKDSIELRDWLLAIAIVPFFWVYFSDNNLVTASLKSISRFGPTISFILLSLELKKRVAVIWLKFFVYSLVPGILIHIIKLGLSVDFPVFQITNSIGEVYSSHFFVYFYSEFNYIRFCGIYDEPGVLGTFALLFLLFWDSYLSRFQIAVLWIAGVLSLSFYFIASIPIILIIKWVRAKRYILLFLFSLSAVLLVTNAESLIKLALNKTDQSGVYEDIIFQTIKSRFSIEEGSNKILSINTNRLNFNKYIEEYNFKSFMNEDIVTILFGNFLTKGSKKFADDTGSGLGHEIFLYENGFLLYIYAYIFIIILSFFPAQNGMKYTILSILLILMCFYQRPNLYRAEILVIIYQGAVIFHMKYKEKFTSKPQQALQ